MSSATYPTASDAQSRDVTLKDDDEKSQSDTVPEIEDGSHRQNQDNEEHKESLQLSRPASNTLSRVTSRLTTTRNIVDPGPPPDGGIKAWTQVAMAWLVVVTTWGYLNSFGVFQTYYESHIAESPSSISWIGSLQLWVVFFVSTFSGRALDAGLFIPMFAIGSFIQVFGIFMNSLCRSYWQLLLAEGICTGLGSGIIFIPTMGLVTTYFSKNRGLAVAIFTTGNSTGGTIYPIVIRELLPKIGFPWTVRVIAFINLAFLSTSLAFLRPRLPPRKSGPIVEWRAFTELPYACTILGFTLTFGATFFSYYYIGSYGRDILHMSYESSTNLVIILNAIGIPARLCTGYLADKFTGPLNGIIPLMFLNGVMALTWIAVTTVAGMYIETSFYGLLLGAFQCLFPTVVTSLHSDLSKNGVRLGMAFSVFSFAGLTGPPIGGALLMTNGGGRGGWLSALLGVGIATMLGTFLLCVARVRKAGWTLKTKC